MNKIFSNPSMNIFQIAPVIIFWNISEQVAHWLSDIHL
jgi:hypothetical protein